MGQIRTPSGRLRLWTGASGAWQRLCTTNIAFVQIADPRVPGCIVGNPDKDAVVHHIGPRSIMRLQIPGSMDAAVTSATRLAAQPVVLRCAGSLRHRTSILVPLVAGPLSGRASIPAENGTRTLEGEQSLRGSRIANASTCTHGKPDRKQGRRRQNESSSTTENAHIPPLAINHLYRSLD